MGILWEFDTIAPVTRHLVVSSRWSDGTCDRWFELILGVGKTAMKKTVERRVVMHGLRSWRRNKGRPQEARPRRRDGQKGSTRFEGGRYCVCIGQGLI